MAQAFRADEFPRPSAALEQRLRTSLRDARGNLAIRRRLVQLARDPERLAALRDALGAGHALLHELRDLAPERAGAQASGATRRARSSAGGFAPTPQLRTPSTQS